MPNEPDREQAEADREHAADREMSSGRSTPGDPVLAGGTKDEVDRYVEWQHDPEMEYLHGK